MRLQRCRIVWQIAVFFILVHTAWCFYGQKGNAGRQLLQSNVLSKIFTDINPVCEAEVVGKKLETQFDNSECDVLDQDCNTSPILAEIFNYIPAPVGRFPYFVSLQQKRVTNQGITWFRHFCGGAMLTNDILVTTAHCVYQRGVVDFRESGDGFGNGILKNDAIYVALGPYCRHQQGIGRKMATEFFLHPNYTGIEYESDDLALLKVETPYSYHGPFPNYKSAKYQQWDESSGVVTAMGHGASNKTEKSNVSVFSKVVSPLGLGFLQYTPLGECNTAVKSVNQIFEVNPQKMICFKTRAQLTQDTCVGDSGGPVVIADDNYGMTPNGDPSKDILVGLTSWGPDTTCDGLALPGVYNNLANYVDWITNVLETHSDYFQAPSPIIKQPALEGETPLLKHPVLTQILSANDDDHIEESPKSEYVQHHQETPKAESVQEPKQLPQVEPSLEPVLVSLQSSSPQVYQNLPEICQLKMDKGPCEGDQKRWYYDSASEKCIKFSYGGCAGNKNNFKTKDLCELKCSISIGSLI